jgi:hypothetical protein
MARKPASNETPQETTMSETIPTNGSTFDPATAVISVDDGAITFPWSTLPEVSKYRLAKGGMNHMLGNEVASQVSNMIRKELGHSKTNQVTTEQIKAYRAANPDKVAAWDAEFTAAKVKAIREGTIADRAVSTREPARSPLDRLALAKMGVAVEQALKRASDRRVAAGGTAYVWKASEINDRVKALSANPEQMTKYRALAQAELDAMGGGDELEVELAA